jgi:hypothetical protein
VLKAHNVNDREWSSDISHNKWNTVLNSENFLIKAGFGQKRHLKTRKFHQDKD